MTIPHDLFGDKPEPPKLTGITRQNVAQRLAAEPCPLCGSVGNFTLFDKGPHVGVGCGSCGREHIFRSRGLMWVPGTKL